MTPRRPDPPDGSQRMEGSELLERLTRLSPAGRQRVLERVGDAELTATLLAPDQPTANLPEGDALDWFATGGGAPDGPEEGLRERLALALSLEEGEEESLVGETIGRVKIVGLLGRGGMGAVYRGYDTALERTVAVKVLHPALGGTEGWRERFRGEARLLSAVEHPSICRVYDLVDGEACDYLVLEYVEGLSFGDWLETDPSREERLRAVRRVAEALAVAHERRIVHRDLKPDNVMVLGEAGEKARDGDRDRDPDRDGEAEVKVLDFGIAVSISAAEREESEASPGGAEAPEDASGYEPAGTLLYMSPEQARGESVDAASDVFALGLLLQEALTGRSAYPRDLPLGRLAPRVARGETEAPEGLDAEALALVQRLQSPLPSRRPSAAEAARALEDLERAPLRRRRRKQLAALAALVLLVILASAVAVVRERLQSAQTATAIQSLSREAEEIAWTMRAAQLGPTRDLSPVRDDLLARMAALEERLPELSREARGLASSALGRAYLELGEADEARPHLDAAWEAGSRDASTAWARSLVYGRLWAQETEERHQTAGRDSEPTPEALAKRATALAMLEAAAGAAPEDHLQALLALYEGRTDEGLEAARRLAASDPAQWRARVLEAQLLRARAVELDVAGDARGAVGTYADARRAALDAAEIARAAPQPWQEACVASSREAWLTVRLLEEPYEDPLRATAEEVCHTAEDVAPWSLDTRAWLSTLDLLAIVSSHDLAEAERIAEASIRRMDEILALDPERLHVRYIRGQIRQVLADRKSFGGQEVGDLYDRALEDLKASRDASPHDPAYVTSYCSALGSAAIHAVGRGHDDAARLVRLYGEEAARGAALFPEADYFPNYLQFALLMEGNLQYGAGEPCAEAYLEALEVAERRADSADIAVAVNGVAAGVGVASCRLREGLEPGDGAERALKLADYATERRPTSSYAWYWEAGAHLAVAQVARHDGRYAQKAFENALEAWDRGLELDPGQEAAVFDRAWVHVVHAATRLDLGRPAGDALVRARAALEAGIEEHGMTQNARRVRAHLAAVAARAEGSPDAIRRAEQRLQEAREAGVKDGTLWQVHRELDKAAGGEPAS